MLVRTRPVVPPRKTAVVVELPPAGEKSSVLTLRLPLHPWDVDGNGDLRRLPSCFGGVGRGFQTKYNRPGRCVQYTTSTAELKM